MIRTTRHGAADEVELAVHEIGEGRPLLLLHGFFSDAETNWIKFGHAALLAEAGYRVIMPDLRAHGQSGKPHEAAAYPPDVLARDALGLIAELGVTDYDLGGYSLGARTAVRMLVSGARPARVVLSGMGLEGIVSASRRADHFRHLLDNLGKHERGSPAWMGEQFLKTTGGDPVALRHIIDTFVDTPRAALDGIAMPVTVVCGTEDQDNGSAADLAAALPRGTLIEVPGNHMSAVVKPDLGIAFRDWLGPANEKAGGVSATGPSRG
jgi:pimeloyl-ACP methyl ester carboxylesterase